MRQQVAEMSAAGVSVTEQAERLGVSPGRVSQIRNDLGLVRRYERFTLDELNDAVDMRLAGSTLTAIANELGKPFETVRLALRKELA